MQNEGAWEAEIEAARAELRDIEAATERQVCHHFDYGGGGSYCWGGSSQGAAFPGGAARGEAVGADAQARWRHGRGRWWRDPDLPDGGKYAGRQTISKA